MAEIDPVILELRAQVDRYMRDVERATRRVEDQLGRQQRDVRRLEDQFRRSGDGISASLKGLAATLATAFTGTQLVGLIDSYTRFQNQLKVAGLEGEKFAVVQEKLRRIAGTYGVELESLGTTFSRIAQVQGDLGASTEDIIRLNEIVAASLKVAGTDAQAASGALLQLGQALGSGTVRAEEFNSILEGALPLAQAAARGIEGYGGNVAKLRAAIAEGNVTSQEFFQGVLRGGIQTLTDAEGATLTLSGAFTALRNELTLYVGEAAKSSGTVGVLTTAIQKLADNLDVIIPALAAIAIALGVRVVGGAVSAAASFVGLRVVALGLAVQLNGTAAAATLLQRSLLAAVGGPVGAALGALTVAFIAFGSEVETAAQKTDRFARAAAEADETARLYEQRLREAGVAVADTGNGADVAGRKVNSFAGQMLFAADAAIKLAESLRIAELAKIGARLGEVRAERTRLQEADRNRPSRQSSGTLDGLVGRGVRDYVVPLAEKITGEKATTPQDRAAQLASLDFEERRLIAQALAIRQGAEAGIDVTKPAPSAPSPAAPRAPRSTSPRGSQIEDRSAEVEARYRDELDNIRIRIQQAESERATTAEERAEYEGRQLEFAEDMALRQVDLDKDYTDAQKAEIKSRLIALGEAERDNIEFRKRAELEREAADIAAERGRALVDGLRLQFDLATTEKDRRRIALEIIAAEQAILRERLQQQIDNTTLSDAVREQARIALKALDEQAAAQVAATKQQFATPLERFADRAKDQDTAIEEAVVRRVQDINRTITDSFTNALGIKDPFLSELISIFLDRNVFGPLAEAFASQGGSGGGILGGLGSLLGGLFGRASGGPVMAGRAYRVNEGAPIGKVEAFVPNTSGQIIPLGRMNAAQSGGSQSPGTATVRLELSGDIDARIERVAGPVAVEVVRVTAPTVIDAAANETFRRANRPGL